MKIKALTKKRPFKIFSIFASLGTIVASSFGISSCGISQKDIVLITDAGVVTDESFNQSSWEALKDIHAENKSRTIGYVQPIASDVSSLTRVYDVSIDELRPKVLVLSGFLHIQNGLVDQYSKKHPDVTFLGVDFNSSMNPSDIPNFAGITFNAAQSGFMSAIYTGLYFNLTANVNSESKVGYYEMNGNPSSIKVATFGGLPIPSVTGYMDGYQLGAKYFNDHIDTEVKADPEIWDNSRGLTPRKINMVYQNGSGPSMGDFTGSFDKGNEKVFPLCTNYYNQGANLILPVAGPQMETALGLANPDQNKWVYGIDTDQSKIPTYSNQKYKIFGSSIKNIKAAVQATVKKVYTFIDKGERPTNQSTLYDLKQSNLDGINYVGFTPNADYGTQGLTNGKDVEETITKQSRLWQDVIVNPDVLNDISWDYRGVVNPPDNFNLDIKNSYGQFWG